MTTLPSGRRRSMDPRSAPGMLEGFPRLEPAAILDGDFQTSIQGAGSEPGKMRSDDHVVKLEHSVIGWDGLGCKHVQASPAEMTTLERF